MCGIFGILGKSGLVSEQLVEELTNLVAHRGPDGIGVSLKANVGLGHRRLAIIDLSKDGVQPMRHRDEPLTITYNGEIYNYLELRAELQKEGAVFKTATDTEVLLNAYLFWGMRCLEKLNGMWAFAIHDERNDTIFCARDRFGVKPFYYIENSDAFAFASEIRQLLPLIPTRTADSELVNDFLVCGLTDHTSRTFFEGVRKLPGGHCLTANCANGSIHIERYYTLKASDAARKASPECAAVEIRRLLEDATKLRLRSDVRVGTCLSGGLDSSSVATLAAAQQANRTDEPFCAITAVSEDETNNEEKFAASIVQNSALNWIRTRPQFEDFIGCVDDLVETQEEPFAGPSIMMQYSVMRASRSNGVVVLLDGQGGDETLLGYDRYYAAWLLEELRISGVAGFISAVRAATSINANLTIWRILMYLFGGRFGVIRELAYRWRYGFLTKVRLPDALWRFAKSTRSATDMQKLEITETNLPMLLRFEDKNSMRFSIETRLPFLDYRLVEYAIGLNVSVKLKLGWTKWVLRAAMAGVLPAEICWRRDKIGFAAPDKLWLGRYGDVMKRRIVSSAFIAKFADVHSLERRFNKIDLGMRWRLYCLTVWSDHFRVEAK